VGESRTGLVPGILGSVGEKGDGFRRLKGLLAPIASRRAVKGFESPRASAVEDPRWKGFAALRPSADEAPGSNGF